MIKTIFLGALALSSSVFGANPEPSPIKEEKTATRSPMKHSIEEGLVGAAIGAKKSGDWYAEFKIGYYEFQNSILRKIFHKGGLNLGGEVGYILPESPFGFWINGFYLEKKGHAIENGPKVEIELGTIAIGMRLLYRPVECFDLFAGIGPRIFIPKIKNNSPYVQKWDQRAQGGGAFLAGFSLHTPRPQPRIWIEAFFDYSFWGYDNHRNSISSLVYDVDFSFWNVGGSLGLAF